jgi:hypothetical protein
MQVSFGVESERRISEENAGREGGMSAIFDFVAAEIERQTELEKLEARGTVRLALKEAGFNPSGITTEQMAVVLERVMPGELVSRGVEDAESICSSLVTSIKEFRDAVEEQGGASPESVFTRLAGG